MIPRKILVTLGTAGFSRMAELAVKRRTTSLTAAALACVMALVSTMAQAQWGGKPELSAADRRNIELQEATPDDELWSQGDYYRDPKEWRRNWRRTQRRGAVEGDEIAWGKEKRPVRSRVIVLDPPLAKTTPPDRVEIEWFHSHIDESGQWGVWVQTWLQVTKWNASLLKARVPVTMNHRVVGKGPTLLRVYNDRRRAYQELIYAWEGGANRGKPGRAVQYHLIQTRDRVDQIASRTSLEKIVEAAGQSVEEWRALVDTERTRARITEANERFRELMTQAAKVTEKALRTPQDPILLINGKYLLMSPVSGKMKDLFRMANWIIRTEIERLPHHGFDAKKIAWGNKTKPKRGELTELRTPFAHDGKISIEWAHTYVTADGVAKPVAWFEDVRHAWEESLRKAGITQVRYTRVPMVDKEGRAIAHQRIHREATIAWGPELRQRRNLIHWAMARHLATNPLGLGNHDAVGKLLDTVPDMNRAIYEAVRGSSSRVRMLEEARQKGEAIAEVLGRNDKAGDPVFLVNGRYVVGTPSVTRTYQILNWLITELRDGT